MLKTVRRNVVWHGDICLELCLSVELLHVEQSIFTEASPLHLFLLILGMLRFELLHGLLLVDLFDDFFADCLVAESASDTFDGILYWRFLGRGVVAA